MFVSSDYLEVAIGLVFVFLLLSLLATWIQELIAQALSFRSKDLVGIIQLLLDPNVKKGEGFKKWEKFEKKLKEGVDFEKTVKELEQTRVNLEKELTALTGRKKEAAEKKLLAISGEIKIMDGKDLLLNFYQNGVIKALAEPGKRPSYIPAQGFATALLDIVSEAGGPQIAPQTLKRIKAAIDELEEESEETKKKLLDIVEQVEKTTGVSAEELLENVKTKMKTVVKPAALDFLLKAGGAEDTQAEIALRKIRAGISQSFSETNPARKALLAIVDNAEVTVVGKAEKKVAAVRQGIETWYDATNERASGWYKRNMYRLAFIIGMLLAVIANADTIAITKVLLEDRAVREAVTGQAVAWSQRDETEQQASAAKEELKKLGVPLGWTKAERKRLGFPIQMTDEELEQMGQLPNPGGAWISKIFGLIITGFAISRGSSVWFDLLGRLVNMRGTGQKPKEAAAGSG